MNKHEIKVPQLGGTFGNEIERVFKNIDENFNLISESDFLKGARGNSVFLKTIDLSKDPTLIPSLKDAVKSQYTHLPVQPKKVNGVDVLNQFDTKPGLITIIYETENDIDYPISSLPYIFKDDRFNDTSAIQTLDDETDWSCVIYYDRELRQFVPAQEFPTLYYEDGFKWKINGIKTGLDAQGPKGPKGDSSSFKIVLAEHSAGSEYIITHIIHEGQLINVKTTSSSQIDACTNLGVATGTTVMAIITENSNATYASTTYEGGGYMKVYCSEMNRICEVKPIGTRTIEEMCSSAWGEIING